MALIARHLSTFCSLVFLALAAQAVLAGEPSEQNADLKFQATWIGQSKQSFSAPYTGPHSLVPSRESSRTFTMTAYAGVRPWQGGELFINPEAALGVPLSGLTGLGGFTNGEIARVSGPDLKLYRARLFVRHTVGLGGESEWQDADQNRLAGPMRADRLVLTAGNFSALDVFDANAYSHEPRRQFMNWSLMTHGAWDFPADARGYTWGAAAEYITRGWAARAGRFLQPRQSNGLALNYNFHMSYGDALEIERAHAIAGRAGRVRLLAFRNVARMGDFQQAIDLAAATGGVPDIGAQRQRRAKAGWGINVEQSIAPDAGAFFRASRNDGRTETFAFTEIDRSISAGVVWNRERQEFGTATVRNGLSRSHRDYLAAGGLGFFLGDGALNYRPEHIWESYLSQRLNRLLWLSAGYQRIWNPGYNADRRGPVDVVSLRLHAEF